MRVRLGYHRIHLNITSAQYEYLARRAFVETTTMADVARDILEEARKRDLRKAALKGKTRPAD
jgi:hypothetical protein